jgi:hypothetical protein
MTNCLNIKKTLIVKGFLEILENLTSHPNKLVAEKAVNIMEGQILCEMDI